MTCNGWHQGRLQNSRSPPGYFRRWGGKQPCWETLCKLCAFKTFFLVCWSWAYFLLLSDPCIHTRSFSEVWKSAVDHRSSLLSVFLLLTLRLNVISVNGYHLLNATKEGSGCWCGSMFASGRERLDTWEAGFWSWRYFPCSVAFGNWLCESFVVVLLVFRFVVSSPLPSQLSGKTHWNFTNGVLLLPIYRFIFFLLITCGDNVGKTPEFLAVLQNVIARTNKSFVSSWRKWN